MDDDEGRTVSMRQYTLACNQATDLQRQLREAQEERDSYRAKWQQGMTDVLNMTAGASAARAERNDAIERAERVEALAEARKEALGFTRHHLAHVHAAPCKAGPDRCTKCLVQRAIDLTPAEAQRGEG